VGGGGSEGRAVVLRREEGEGRRREGREERERGALSLLSLVKSSSLFRSLSPHTQPIDSARAHTYHQSINQSIERGVDPH
jgi:hypothetical protein